MDNSLMQIIGHLPWWVYLLMLYLIKKGMETLQPKVVPMKKLVITPLIFLYLSIHSLLSQSIVTDMQVIAWTAAALAGVLSGIWLVFQLELAFDRVQYLVRVPGSWSTIAVILLVFTSKFYLGYTAATDGGQAGQEGLKLLALAGSGFGSGIITGRVIGYFYRFIGSKSVGLAE